MSACFIGDSVVVLNLVWLSILHDNSKLKNSIISFYSGLDVGNFALLAQGIMDYVEQFQAKEGTGLDLRVESNCRSASNLISVKTSSGSRTIPPVSIYSHSLRVTEISL